MSLNQKMIQNNQNNSLNYNKKILYNNKTLNKFKIYNNSKLFNNCNNCQKLGRTNPKMTRNNQIRNKMQKKQRKLK